MKKEIEKIADKLVYAYKKNKLINPIPIKFTKNIQQATKLRKLCESKIKTKVSKQVVEEMFKEAVEIEREFSWKFNSIHSRLQKN